MIRGFSHEGEVHWFHPQPNHKIEELDIHVTKSMIEDEAKRE